MTLQKNHNCTAITTSVLCNQNTLLICQLLFSTLILAFFKVGIQNPVENCCSVENLYSSPSQSQDVFLNIFVKNLR